MNKIWKEKRMGNVPAVTNDRDKACLPELQINFMVHIAEPAYKFVSIFKFYICIYICM